MEVLSIGVAMILGLIIGYQFKNIQSKLDTIIKLRREPEAESSVTSPLPPGVADVTTNSSVVTPKSPAQVDFEDQQRVRDLA